MVNITETGGQYHRNIHLKEIVILLDFIFVIPKIHYKFVVCLIVYTSFNIHNK
jgi:hypothetical protein